MHKRSAERSQQTSERNPLTNVDQHIKRNLIIFVTARLLNPAGQVVTAEETEEGEELIQPPILPEIPFYKK